jgi:hypothetical protein
VETSHISSGLSTQLRERLTETYLAAYFDSLTGITEIESGEFSEELKIKGKPELQKNEKSRDLKKHVINEVLRVLHIVYGESQRN